MKLGFNILLFGALLSVGSAYAEVGTVQKLREFSFRNEEERRLAENRAREMIEATYQTLPDVENCRSGMATSEQKRRAQKELNAIRRAHGLEEVGYDSSKDRQTAASALIAAANNQLDHYPTRKMKCYTKDGYEGSSNGNLHLNYASTLVFTGEDFVERVIDKLVIDDNVYSLGHRLWFLDPFLGSISYGRSTKIGRDYSIVDGVTVYVGNQKAAVPNTKADYIAYPYKNYKSRWFLHDWYSSFSVIVDKTDKRNNISTVDYSKAEIRVTNADGKAMKISGISHSAFNTHSAYVGLGNSLQWRVIGTRDEQRYNVKIKNVIINGVSRDYEYWFKIQP